MQRAERAVKPAVNPLQRQPAVERTAAPAAPGALAEQRTGAIVQSDLLQLISQSPSEDATRPFSQSLHNSPRMVAQRQQLRDNFGEAVQLQGGLEDEEPLQGRLATAQRHAAEKEEEPLQGPFETAQRQGAEDEKLQMKAAPVAPAQLEAQSPPPPNRTGLPDGLKSGIESLSGMAIDQVRVHYNSAQPTQLNALAYAQGNDIHVAPQQERHLPHEAWHVVQQAQGRVQPTMQMKNGVPVNDDEGLEREADVMGEKAAAGAARAYRHDARPDSGHHGDALQLHGGLEGDELVQAALDTRSGSLISQQARFEPVSAHRASHLTIQRWPTALPDEKGERPEFDSLEVYFRRLASLPNESAKAVAEALLKAMFPWKPQPPWQLREDDVQEAVALQKKLGITQGDWGGLVFEAQSRLKVSPRANPTFEPPQQNKLDHRAVIASAVERIEAENEGKKEPKFRLLYNESELFGLVDQAALLGIDAEECAEIILIGCRTAKPRSAEQLKDQMHNLKMVVGKQGHPFKFDNREHLRDLTNRLIDLVGNMTLFQQKIPANDIRIQGSSLRTPLAEDVDIAVFVSEDEFATLCRNRYAGRVKNRGEKADSVLVQMPTTHGGLVELAQLIRKQPKAYSPEAGSFADMLLGGKFDGKTRSSDMALADLTQKIAHEFKSLNIESVTILVRGGPFDLKPYLLLQYR